MSAYRVVPGWLRNRVRATITGTSLLQADLRRKLQHTFLGCSENLESLYLDNFSAAFSKVEQARLCPASGTSSPYQSFLRYWQDGAGRNMLGRLLYADQKTYLVELLMKQDQMSMSASIESRVPLLDHPLVEFAARVPDHLKLRGATGKYIVKKAVEDLLPHEILYRRKMGFPTPMRKWLLDSRAAPLYELLRARHGLLAAYVDGAALEVLLDRHQRGVEDATDRIWRLLNFQIWGEIFLSGKDPREVSLLSPAIPQVA
jgi:asparagine synthase (glutamine-hydrolysing)